MHIRPAVEDDIPHLIQLHGQRDEGHYRGVLKEMSRAESVLLVAENEGKIIGQVTLRYYGTRHISFPVILDLRVSAEARGQGVGSELIAICEHLAGLKGFNVIGITVNPTLNPRARRLYERLGYVPTGQPEYLDGQIAGQENWIIDMTKRIVSLT
jgi:ribosomal protein S18 acetylase RimI-like enzyme